MSRTDIEIDDDLIAKVIEQNGLKTKKGAVDFELRRVVRSVPSASEILALEGIGFEYSNDEVAAMSAPRDLR